MANGEYQNPGERKKPVWPWVLLGCGILAVVAVPIMAIVAAIAIPSLLAARRGSLETNAVGSMRAYCSAQSMYHRNDWEMLGKGPGTQGTLEYARPYTWLNTQKDGSGTPIQLIDTAFANASVSNPPTGTTMPKHGYIFDDMQTLGGQPIDWLNDYGLCGTPSIYGRTGYRTFIVCTNGTVFGTDQGLAGIVVAYPQDPSMANPPWIIAE
jgi:type II secretory pathway pseudopilin PulG